MITTPFSAAHRIGLNGGLIPLKVKQPKMADAMKVLGQHRTGRRRMTA